MDRFRSDLFSKGVVDNVQTGSGWTKTFDCVFFCRAFQVLAEEEYNRAAGHDFNQTSSLAIIQVNYYRDGDVGAAKARGWNGQRGAANEPDGHAILVVVTEHGAVLFDPQTGEVHLSLTELQSVFFVLA